MHERTTHKAKRAKILIACDVCGVPSYFPLCPKCEEPWAAQQSKAAREERAKQQRERERQKTLNLAAKAVSTVRITKEKP